MNVKLVCEQAAKAIGYQELKREQLNAMTEFVSGRDVFVVLPTGFGKSLIYASLPIVFDTLLGTQGSTIVVVTPLTAIMKDQVASFTKKGLSAGYVTSDSESDVTKKVLHHEFQLVFFTPEALLLKRKWRNMLKDDNWNTKLKGFIVDEAHCVKKWGETFRETMLRMGEIRSLIPPSVNMMALTATATRPLRTTVASILGMLEPTVIAVSPCKANIMYAIEQYESMDVSLGPIVKRLDKERTKTLRLIIYCRSYSDCADLFIYFRDKLGSCFTEPPGAPNISKFCLADMFTSITDQAVKDNILTSFQTLDSPLRVVISTIAFGMGVDCPDVRQVVHFGLPDDVESYIQETGRAGRDGHPALALLLRKPRKGKKVDKQVDEYVRNSTDCRRDCLFKDIDNYKHVDFGQPCLCCDVCAQKCVCGVCSINHSNFVFTTK